jgi:hypothetical protein
MLAIEDLPISGAIGPIVPNNGDGIPAEDRARFIAWYRLRPSIRLEQKIVSS